MSRSGKFCVAGIVLVFWFGIGLGPLLSPLLYTLTPLQRYYLWDYIVSSWHSDNPEATIKMRWVSKVRPAPPEPETAPKARHKVRPQPAFRLEHYFATERDVFRKPLLDTVWNGNELPFLLSADAEREGWTGLEQDSTGEFESIKVAAFLRERYFDGEAWWLFFVQPACALGILVLLGLIAKTWIEGWRERHLWGRPLTRRELLYYWMFEPRMVQRALPLRAAPRQIEAAVAPAPKPPPRPKADTPPARAVPQPAPAPAANAAAETKAVFVWDPSKEID